MWKKFRMYWGAGERANDKYIYFFWQLAKMKYVPLPGFWLVAPLSFLGGVLLWRRRNELGPWDAASARAGLHPAAMEFVADRQVAVLGSDSNNDTAGNAADQVEFPVHVLAINALGVHLLDYLQFGELVPACEEAGRWSFLCVIAPLRLQGGTGSPVNPIAIL